MDGIAWTCTTKDAPWRQMGTQPALPAAAINLRLTGEERQRIEGFGGCFNELGWLALQGMDGESRDRVIRDLFHPTHGCRFSVCRLPIGASDYAAEWYSYDEHDGDYAMERFSIGRDRGCLIPYVKAAMAYNPDLALFASPWSPPVWMKYPRAYNYGKLVWDRRTLDAYALYFVRYVQSYAAEGISIRQIHVQNEPVADQKFPSCLWTGEELRDFIRDYLGPAFDTHGIGAEIWLGTINAPDANNPEKDYDSFANAVLGDEAARRYVAGVGYQWGGKLAIQRTHEAWPDLPLMQTENECGDGQNTWAYARYVFNLMKHYFMNGVQSYVYWNMALAPGGRSTWGWPQNTMITVDKASGNVVYNPEFYVMKHLSHFVDRGARLLGVSGQWAGNTLAFRNPGGAVVLAVSNPFDGERALCADVLGRRLPFRLPAASFSTVVVRP